MHDHHQLDESEHIKLPLMPVVKMTALTLLVAIAVVLVIEAVKLHPHYGTITEASSWVLADLAHVPQFVIPFALILVLSKGKLGAYGFNMNQKPPTFTYLRMLGLGILCGALMSIRHIVQAVKGLPLDVPQPVTPGNVFGQMTFQWIVVGLAEETMFRGLIQTYLMEHLRGYVDVIGHRLHIGTILGAILWGLFHFINILVMPLGPVLGTVIFTTLAGLLMGYAYQETRSLLTTIIVHNTLFGFPLTVSYILYWLL
jgi:membrane protease YdiL (CAAX protease family)